MSSTPPRRSRPKPPSGGSSLPFIPIIIGVVVFGFVIGAGLSVMGRHGSGDTVAMATSSPFTEASDATAVPTPIPGAPETPVLAATAEASATPPVRPSERATAIAKASAGPQATKGAHVVANAQKTAASPSVSPEAHATFEASPSPPAQASVPATAVATRKPAPAATPVAPALAVTTVPSSSPVTAAPAAVVDADGTFATLAGNVVKQYLLSMSRGDTDSAYAALGDGPGSHSGPVPELGAVDPTMHIQKIEARGSETSATVNVDLTTASGPYYGQYTVHKSATGAAIIVSHTFGKP